jgi:hypothetical protein
VCLAESHTEEVINARIQWLNSHGTGQSLEK